MTEVPESVLPDDNNTPELSPEEIDSLPDPTSPAWDGDEEDPDE